MIEITVYAIDRDNNDGQYVRRHAFERLDGSCVNLTDARGLVWAQDTDGGEVGTLLAPDGTRVGPADIVLPDGTSLWADDAVAAARDHGHLRMGLAWEPVGR